MEQLASCHLLTNQLNELKCIRILSHLRFAHLRFAPRPRAARRELLANVLSKIDITKR
eukprot:gene9036-8718_t